MNEPTEMHILNRHLYRSKHQDEEKPAITIPFSTLREAIEVHLVEQNKKCQYDSADDEEDIEALEALDQHLQKRPRIQE